MLQTLPTYLIRFTLSDKPTSEGAQAGKEPQGPQPSRRAGSQGG